MTLQQWVSNGWLNSIDASSQEIENALRIAKRELADASLEGISPDGQFEHAYNAVRSLCQAALLAEGFRVPKGQRQHERVIESLKFTLGENWTDTADYYDRCRRMRHQSMYDSDGIARPEDANELVESAQELQTAVLSWLTENHSNLM